jgi:hypothetical protein
VKDELLGSTAISAKKQQKDEEATSRGREDATRISDEGGKREASQTGKRQGTAAMDLSCVVVQLVGAQRFGAALATLSMRSHKLGLPTQGDRQRSLAGTSSETQP